MKKYVPGLQLYSVRDELARDFEGTLKRVAEMGYKNVEFAGDYGGLTGEQVKETLDKYGLISVSVHQNIELFLEKGQEAVDFFKTFGVKYVTVPYYQEEHFQTEEARRETLENFTKVAKLLAENGITMQYHNHDFEFKRFPDGKTYLDWLYENIPAELLKPQLDVCWVTYGGEDPAKYIRKYADRISTIHLKDFTAKKLNGGAVYELIGIDSESDEETVEDNGFRFRALGRGIMDFGPIFDALEDTPVEYLIVE